MKAISLLILTFMFLALSLKAQSQDSLKTANDSKKDSLKLCDQNAIYSRLSADQIYQLEQQKIELHHPRQEWHDDTDRTTTVIFLLTVLAIVFILSYFKHKRTIKLYDLYLYSMEKDKEIPIELLVNPKDDSNSLKNNFMSMATNPLQKGVLLIAIGIGLSIAVSHFREPINQLTGIGFIPICLGLGFIVLHFIDRKKQ